MWSIVFDSFNLNALERPRIVLSDTSIGYRLQAELTHRSNRFAWCRERHSMAAGAAVNVGARRTFQKRSAF